MAEDWKNGGFGLYVHWPFCEAKCPYCDFNSHVTRNIDQPRWSAAYLRELERVANCVPGRVLNTIYFGGGTPSLMTPGTVADVIAAAKSLWPTANDMEVTLEANPGSVETERFAGFRDAGVTRVSMGIQALDDTDLRRLGRMHTVSEAQAAFEIARGLFDRVSFDLIYARQHQTLSQWETELRAALSMAVDHLSLYQLTIEGGTVFGERFAAGKLHGLPSDDLSADMYELTQQLCESHGFPRYEISNHARPGSESRHNLIYWRYGDYLGIGPGAHGRLTVRGQRYATECLRAPGAWLAAAESGSGECDRIRLSGLDQAQEYLMIGLRVGEGIDIGRYEKLAGVPLYQGARSRLVDLGMLTDDGSRITVTNQGFIILNAVIKELLA